jgi:hypothetical protein
MMTTYLDESGQTQKQGRMVVAGFAGTDEQWEAFDAAWKEAIKPKTHLHLNEFRFKKDHERRILERAGKIPEELGLMPLGASVDYSDYADLVTGNEDERVYPGYFACLQDVVINTLRGIPSGETLQIVFERQDRYSDLVDSNMRLFMAMPNDALTKAVGREKLAGWSWVEKGATPRTEAADYLAYALLQAYRDMKSTKSRWCSLILPTDGELYGHPLTKPMVRRIVLRAQEYHRKWR